MLEELRRLREEGVAIGVSVTGPEQAETIRRALEVGIFDTVQATWNLLALCGPHSRKRTPRASA